MLFDINNLLLKKNWIKLSGKHLYTVINGFLMANEVF